MAISLLLLTHRRAAEIHPLGAGYGYGVSPRQRLASAGLALGVAGGIGAALVFAIVAPELTQRPETPLSGSNIFIPEPIDPVPQPTTERPPTPVDSVIRVPPIADDFPPLGHPPIGEVDSGPVGPAGPVIGEGSGGGGSGGGEAIEFVPTPTPIFREATRDPRFARTFQPNYPPALEREGVTGTAQVRVRIDREGRVIAVEDLGATDPAFFAATQRQALRYWRFRPATRDGEAVETSLVLTVRFEVPPSD